MLGHIKEKFFLLKNKDRIKDTHQVLWVYTIVFIIWGLYRLLFRMNIWVEETVLKAVVFGLPVFWIVLKKEGKQLKDLGMVTKGLLVSLYFGLLFGVWLAVFGNVISFVGNGSLGFNPDLTISDFRDLMILGLVTAFWEQLLFTGYMLPRFVKDFKDELLAGIFIAFLFALLHMPVQLVSGATTSQLFVRFVLLLSLQFGNAILYLRFKNLAAPIFAHLAWGSVIFLFG